MLQRISQRIGNRGYTRVVPVLASLNAVSDEAQVQCLFKMPREDVKVFSCRGRINA
jgi:hypothetical protein